jgi:hypothetical protein
MYIEVNVDPCGWLNLVSYLAAAGDHQDMRSTQGGYSGSLW